MLHPLFWLNRMDVPITLPNVQQVLSDLSPYFKDIQNSFGKSSIPFYYGALVLLAIMGIALAANAIFKYRTRRQTANLSRHHSDELFNTILDHLDLTTFDRTLLQQVARDTRLRHPSVFLLSPDMFDWSKKIWVQEKGSEQVTAQQKKQMDTISHKLFGPSPTPGTAQSQNNSAAVATIAVNQPGVDDED